MVWAVEVWRKVGVLVTVMSEDENSIRQLAEMRHTRTYMRNNFTDNALRPDGLSALAGSTRRYVHAHDTVVDSNTLEGPSPVPSSMDSCSSIVYGDVANNKLLVANVNTVPALQNFAVSAMLEQNNKGIRLTHSVENEISHYTARSIFHVNALVVVTRLGRHVYNEINERGSLCDLPVNPNSLSEGRNGLYINHD